MDRIIINAATMSFVVRPTADEPAVRAVSYRRFTDLFEKLFGLLRRG